MEKQAGLQLIEPDSGRPLKTPGGPSLKRTIDHTILFTPRRLRYGANKVCAGQTVDTREPQWYQQQRDQSHPAPNGSPSSHPQPTTSSDPNLEAMKTHTSTGGSTQNNTTDSISPSIHYMTLSADTDRSLEPTKSGGCEPSQSRDLGSEVTEAIASGMTFSQAVRSLEGDNIEALIQNNEAILEAIKRKAEEDLPEAKARKQGRVVPEGTGKERVDVTAMSEVPDPVCKPPTLETQHGPPRPYFPPGSKKGSTPSSGPPKPLIEPSMHANEDQVRSDMKNEPKKIRRALRFNPTRKLPQELRGRSDPKTPVDRMLNVTFPVTVKGLLENSGEVHRAWFSALPHDSDDQEETVQDKVGQISGFKVIPQSVAVKGKGEEVHVAQVLSSPVRVDKEVVDAMIDTGAELNCIARGLADYLNLTIIPKSRVNIHVQTSKSVPCVGFTEVPVQISDIIIHTPMWVLDQGEKGFFLGRSWQEQARWGCQTSEFGQVDCWIYTPDGSRQLIFTAYHPDCDPGRRTRWNLWPDEEDKVDASINFHDISSGLLD
ncbi:hypothetical protein KEM55_002877 [Ascosphaera atra]|nr:hypothetical protein KEM55_002877 [Ascosphaera atra]